MAATSPVTSAGRTTLAWSLLVIATLMLLPTLVRATQSFDARAGSSSIRLNRGFDSPESKCKAPAPDTVAIAAIVVEYAAPPVRREFPRASDPHPVSQQELPPDPFRGPPSLPLS